MGNDGKLVAENLFATTSAIVGRTIALTRWSVSHTMMEIMMNDVKNWINMAKTFSSGLQETEFNEYMLVGLGFGLASIVAIGMMIYCRKYK